MVSLEDVAPILANQLVIQPEIIKLDSKLKEDLGGDSLDAVEIVAAVEEKFKIEIENDEVLQIQTVADLIQIIEKKGSTVN